MNCNGDLDEMEIFASIVHHLRKNNVNVYVSKIYQSGLIFGERIYGGEGAYIRDVICVSYLGNV